MFLEFVAARRNGGACDQLMNATLHPSDVATMATRPIPIYPMYRSDIALTTTSFDDLYRREFPGMVAVATALSGYDGEDLVQDAMVKALVNWERVQRLERPGGWCHRVLVNLCRSRFRRRRTADRYLQRLRREEATTAGPSADVLAFWAAVRDAARAATAGRHTPLRRRPPGRRGGRDPERPGRHDPKRPVPRPRRTGP